MSAGDSLFTAELAWWTGYDDSPKVKAGLVDGFGDCDTPNEPSFCLGAKGFVNAIVCCSPLDCKFPVKTGPLVPVKSMLETGPDLLMALNFALLNALASKKSP